MLGQALLERPASSRTQHARSLGSWYVHPCSRPGHRQVDLSFEERDEDPAVWARKNAFAAILTAKNVSDFALYAIWTLREALEGDFPPSPPCPQSASIPAAAAWIQHAGRELIVREDDYGTAGQGGSLWAGKAGFSRERWTFWHTRLQEIATDGKLNERTRLEALRAGKALAELLLLPEGDEARHN